MKMKIVTIKSRVKLRNTGAQERKEKKKLGVRRFAK